MIHCVETMTNLYVLIILLTLKGVATEIAKKLHYLTNKCKLNTTNQGFMLISFA